MWLFSGFFDGLVADILGSQPEFSCMFATILIGRYLSIQGRILQRLPGGQVAIRVGERRFVGRPLRR